MSIVESAPCRCSTRCWLVGGSGENEMNWHCNWMRIDVLRRYIYTVHEMKSAKKSSVCSAAVSLQLHRIFSQIFGERRWRYRDAWKVKRRHEFTISHLCWLFVREVQRNVSRVAVLFILWLLSPFASPSLSTRPLIVADFILLFALDRLTVCLRIRHQCWGYSTNCRSFKRKINKFPNAHRHIDESNRRRVNGKIYHSNK